ncbi:MAG: hypothetical protein ACOCRZ_07810 [Halothermotrichaceae bacterium]
MLRKKSRSLIRLSDFRTGIAAKLIIFFAVIIGLLLFSMGYFINSSISEEIMLMTRQRNMGARDYADRFNRN